MSSYRRRTPERTVLYQTLAGHLETFIARTADPDSGRSLPAFVVKELRAYLECGILAHGFARVRCDGCGGETLVAFSCKGRGFCPSCGGRRMASRAGHLKGRVLPHVPIRQWVLSLPIPVRYLIAHDPDLTGDVLAVFIRALTGWMTRRLTGAGFPGTRTGSVTYEQRFGGALNLNPHLHVLVLDGGYRRPGPGQPLQFCRLPEPTPEELHELTKTIATRTLRGLQRRGKIGDDHRIADDPADDPADDETLRRCAGAAVQGRLAFGPDAGQPLPRGGSSPGDAAGPPPRLLGFDLHAGRPLEPHQRDRLERVCRTIARPPITDERLQLQEDGTLVWTLLHPWSDGTHCILFRPLELIARLAALIPRPRANLVRYHGVLAPAAHWRPEVVPTPPEDEPPETDDHPPGYVPEPEPTPVRPGRWIPWSDLLRRVFGMEVMQCWCGGRRRILAWITRPSAIAGILTALGLPTEPPTIAPAKVQLEFEYA